LAPHPHVVLQAQILPQVQGSACVQPHDFFSHRHSFWVVIGLSSFVAGGLARRSQRQTQAPKRHYTRFADLLIDPRTRSTISLRWSPGRGGGEHHEHSCTRIERIDLALYFRPRRIRDRLCTCRKRAHKTHHSLCTSIVAGSVGLHESLGFVRVGVYRGVGYKLGARRRLVAAFAAGRVTEPPPPRPTGEGQRDPAWQAAMAAAR
jgi:hypothetical protein